MLVHQRYTPAFTRHQNRLAGRSLDRSFDRAFEQLASSFFDTRRATGPVVDGAWVDDEYVLTVDLPGTPAEAVSIEVAGTTLTLAVKTDSLDWKRSLRLGGRLDADKIDAHHVDGRLTVRVGTIDEPQARKIEVDRTAPAIEAAVDSDDQPIEANVTE